MQNQGWMQSKPAVREQDIRWGRRELSTKRLQTGTEDSLLHKRATFVQSARIFQQKQKQWREIENDKNKKLNARCQVTLTKNTASLKLRIVEDRDVHQYILMLSIKAYYTVRNNN